MHCNRVADVNPYLDFKSDFWDSETFTAIKLNPSEIGMQPNDYIINSWENKSYGQLDRLGLLAVHDGKQIAFAMQWVADTESRGEDEGFPDGAVIAFPVKGNPLLMAMGSEEEPIHGLHWRARFNEIRSVVATGIGSSRPGPEMKVRVEAVWSNGVWRVVLVRDLGAPKDAAQLLPGKPSRIGFAVWNGANKERAGIKAITPDWTELNIAP